jgi:DnaJ domain
MDFNSNLFARVRIRAERVDEAADTPVCQFPGCALAGPYRAPMGRDREGSYFQFCMAHVQEYNKSYNYFNGMTDEAVARFQKDAITGHRPTWSLGVKGREAEANAARNNEFSDLMGLFEKAAQKRAAQAEPRPKVSRFGKLSQKALETLHVSEHEATKETIRARYKSWVKQLHPDANGGDRSREEKLREIIRAYNTLKKAGHA